MWRVFRLERGVAIGTRVGRPVAMMAGFLAWYGAVAFSGDRQGEPLLTNRSSASGAPVASASLSLTSSGSGMEEGDGKQDTPSVGLSCAVHWRPGKLHGNDDAIHLRYVEDLLSTILFDCVETNRSTHWPFTLNLGWESPARKKSTISFQGSISTDSVVGRRFFLRSMLPTFDLVAEESKVLAGCDARRMAPRDEEAERLYEEKGLEAWIADAGERLFFGTEAKIVEEIEKHRAGHHEPDGIGVPDAFIEEHSKSSFSLIFDGCDQWEEMIVPFFRGSEKESQVADLFPLLKNLRRVGVFLAGERGSTLRMRIGYDSDASAAANMETVGSLLRWVQASVASDPDDSFYSPKALLSAIEVIQKGDEIVVQLGDSRVAAVLCNEVVTQAIPGWDAVLSNVEPIPASDVVQLACMERYMAPTGFLSQSLRAEKYCGKRVRVSAEFGGADAVQEHCGLIVWACDDELRTVSRGASSDFTLFSFERVKTRSIRWRNSSQCTVCRRGFAATMALSSSRSRLRTG